MSLVVNVIPNISTADIKRLSNLIAAAGKQSKTAIRRAVNHTGDRTKTQLIRALTKQTGLPRKTIVTAVKVTRANYGSEDYVMRTKGGDIALKFFKARETRKGVSAAPRGQRRVFAGTFIKGGLFPARVTLGMGGNVFQRVGKGRTIKAVQSGVIIPVEMLTGATQSAFVSTVQGSLPDRLAHELYRVLPGR